MKPVFVARKHLHPTAVHKERLYNSPAPPRIIFEPSCQCLPGFHTIARITPKEREGIWFVIDY